MAKEYKVGENYYLPVSVSHVYDGDHSYPISIVFNNGVSTSTTIIADEPDLLLTAEEIISNILLDNNNFMTFPSKTLVVSEEETRIKTLTEKVATLTDERDGARKQADIFQEENNKLKRELAERDELLSDAADHIKTLEEAADRSIFFEKIANQQEVIDALVEKIRRLEGGET